MADETSFNWKIDGTGLGQSTAETCWFASYKIIHRHREKPTSVIKEKIVKAGLDFDDYYKNGLPKDDFLKTAKAVNLNAWAGSYATQMGNDLPGFLDLVKRWGPMWCALAKPGRHIVVITGVDVKMKTIQALNPWDNTNGTDAQTQYFTQESFLHRVDSQSHAVLQCL